MRTVSLFFLIFSLFLAGQVLAGTFSFQGQQFLMNGLPFQIIGCEIHYSRIPQEYWTQRIQMTKALGCNTLSVYMMWNFHEPQQNIFDFSSYGKNVTQFLEIAQSEGMYVMIRPGPYICGEWDFGGHPYWLLQNQNLQLRSTNQYYISAITPYVQQVAQILQPMQITQGGPIIMLQIENEYGYWGTNNSYPLALQQIWENTGLIEVPYYTADNSNYIYIGNVPGAAIGLNPGVTQQQWNNKENFNNSIPGLSSETYPGWLTHWGEPWAVKSIQQVVDELTFLLKNNYSFSIYMAHGGTSFGFYAGANVQTPGNLYQPDITSYDYDAPITENGHVTNKFQAIKDLIQQYTNAKIPNPPQPPYPSGSIGNFTPKFVSTIYDNLPSNFTTSQKPVTMEMLGQEFGYILYSTVVQVNKTAICNVTINDLHDYANVYLNGHFYISLYRGDYTKSFTFTGSAHQNVKIDILVEAMGRVNFNYSMWDPKGITSNVTFNGMEILNWNIYNIPLQNINNIVKSNKTSSDVDGQFYYTTFNVQQVQDTYIDMSRWSKGFVWINGINLGRYWNIGPQQRLYCPGVWLDKGINNITIFEMHMKKPQLIETKANLTDFMNEQTEILLND